MGRAPAHLVGAYGMFWDRDAVNWRSGSGPAAWQLLGRINKNEPQLQVCDFRRAKGFYVLFDDFRANYVGLARGRFGIGQRLRSHASHKDNWSRLSWFAFDDVIPTKRRGWSQVKQRDALRTMSSELVLRECEALLITILGSQDQNQMRFQRARRWHQLKESDFLPGGHARNVDPTPFTDPQLAALVRAGDGARRR